MAPEYAGRAGDSHTCTTSARRRDSSDRHSAARNVHHAIATRAEPGDGSLKNCSELWALIADVDPDLVVTAPEKVGGVFRVGSATGPVLPGLALIDLP